MCNLLTIFNKGNTANYSQYFSDESRRFGFADSISFPKNIAEVETILHTMRVAGIPVTVQGARTGLDGAAVPTGGHILNCIKMDSVGSLRSSEDGSFFLTVGSGTSISSIANFLHNENATLFWPPAPTEPSATVGGVIASKARGIYTSKYGEASSWVSRIEKVDEVITSAEIILLSIPQSVWGIAFVFPSLEKACTFILETDRLHNNTIAALELVNKTALDCISDLKKHAARLHTLPNTSGHEALVYAELHSENDSISEETAAVIMKIAESCGSDLDLSWALSGSEEVERIRIICHAAQEAALASHDHRLSGKALGLELMLSPNAAFSTLNSYLTRFTADGIDAAVFGSLTGGRLRICPLPRNNANYENAVRLLSEWKGVLSI